MFGIIKKKIIVLLASIANASNHTKCVSLSIQKCEIHSILIDLEQNGLDKCAGSCNAANGLSNKACIPNKTEDLSTHVFNVIPEKTESKILTKSISCKCKCRFHGKKCNLDQ